MLWCENTKRCHAVWWAADLHASKCVANREPSLITAVHLLWVYLLSEGFCLEFTQTVEGMRGSYFKSLTSPKTQLFPPLSHPRYFLIMFQQHNSILQMCVCIICSCNTVNRHISLSDLWWRWTPCEPKPGPSLLRCWLKKDKAGDGLALIRSGCYCKSQGLLSTGKCLEHVVRFDAAMLRCVLHWYSAGFMGCEESL